MNRTKPTSKKLYKKVPDNGPWQDAIADAEAALVAAKARVGELKTAITILKEKASAGIPFPGQS